MTILRVLSVALLLSGCVLTLAQDGGSNTTTLSPATSEAPDNRTTIASSTPEPTTTITTHKPTPHPTTHQPTPTTTPAPSPPDHPWMVNDSGVICILFEAKITLKLNYKTIHHEMVYGQEVVVPAGASAQGSCGHNASATVQHITLGFFNNWSLELMFKKNKTENKYHIDSFTLEFNADHFENGTNKTINAHGGIAKFWTADNYKYVCTATQSLYSKNVTIGLVEMSTAELQFEAFRTSNTTAFTNSVNKCKDDEVSQLVPIIVGAALGGLIIIVLIAYLIGRRRSRRGYESV